MSSDNLWDDVPIIHRYTRQQALEDGVLIDVSAVGAEAGFKWPVAVTAAVWNDCIFWTEADTERQTHQDLQGRLWDVLWMALCAIRATRPGGGGDRLKYVLNVVPRGGKAKRAVKTELVLVTGPGDEGEPVVTIMKPGED